MRKKILSLLAVLFVAATAFATFVIVKKNGAISRFKTEQLTFEQKGTSFMLNGVDVKDIANICNRDWRSSDDYERAFTEKYLEASSYPSDRKRKVYSLEFKNMLKPLIEKYAPDSMAYFNSRIADVDVPLTRCLAVGMCFYTARCIGALTRNSNASRELGEHFWDGIWENNDMYALLPYENQYKSEGGEYDRVLIDALLWNDGHVSLVSNREVVSPYGDSGNWDWDKPFTWENAVRAITRLHDSIDKGNEEVVYVPITDKQATTPDPEIITDYILAIAAKSTVTKLSELRKLSGPQTAERMTGSNNIPITNWTRYVEDAARWGFNSFLYMFPSNNLVNWENMTANMSYLRMLDRLVAACVENNITLRIEADNLPGAGLYFIEGDKYAEYNEDFTFDLTACEKGCQMWKMLSERYKDIPSEYLIFTPVNGKYDPQKHEASAEAVAKYTCKLIDQIREVSPNRFIYYSYTGNNSVDLITNENAKTFYDMIESKYDNVRIMRNFAETLYVFYNITTGINMDLGNHSTFMPEYPMKTYGACNNIHHDAPLIIDGCLPAGTKIDLYIKSTNSFVEGCKFFIDGDGTILHEETLPMGQKEYNSGYRGTEFFSSFFPYAESEHKISVTLEKAVEKLKLGCSEYCGINWCGLDVYLPESYQVERWYKATQYDLDMGYEEWFFGPKKTSRVMIRPSYGDDGQHVTIHEDVTYTSDYIVAEANKETVNAWGEAIRKFAPQCGSNVENQTYGGCTQESMLRYCDDVYGMMHDNGFDYWISDFDLLYDENATAYRIGWRKVESFDGYANFNVELLRVLQKHQYK